MRSRLNSASRSIGGEEAEAYLYTVNEGHDQPAIREAAGQALAELKARRRGGGKAALEGEGK